METTVITFFSGMLKSFLSVQNPREWQLLVIAPDGTQIKCVNGTMFFPWVAGFCLGLHLGGFPWYERKFRDLNLNFGNGTQPLLFNLIPKERFTGGVNSGVIDFTGHGLEFVTMVMMIYYMRKEGMDIFSPHPINVDEYRQLTYQQQDLCWRYLADATVWGLADGSYTSVNPITGHTGFRYLVAWKDYGINLLANDPEVNTDINALLGLSVDGTGIVFGTGTGGAGTGFEPGTYIEAGSAGGSMSISSVLSNPVGLFALGLGLILIVKK